MLVMFHASWFMLHVFHGLWFMVYGFPRSHGRCPLTTRRSRAHANNAPEGRRVAHSSAVRASISHLSSLCRPAITREPRPGPGRARIHACGARRSPAAALAAADAARPSHVWDRGGVGRRAPLLAWRWRRERGGSAATSGGQSGPYPIEPASAVAAAAAAREVAAHAPRDERGAARRDAHARVCGGTTNARARPREQTGRRAGKGSRADATAMQAMRESRIMSVEQRLNRPI